MLVPLNKIISNKFISVVHVKKGNFVKDVGNDEWSQYPVVIYKFHIVSCCFPLYFDPCSLYSDADYVWILITTIAPPG